MPEIGERLREARMRARIDLSEIESRTKIRAKYLRALENEEWGLLPGPTFVRSFLRTYAQALGLDGKALVEEYRLRHEPGGDAAMEPAGASSQRPPRARFPREASRGYMALIAAVSLLIVLLVVGLLSSGSSSNGSHNAAANRHRAHSTRAPATSYPTVSVSLKATGAVYVCLVGEGGRKLIGETLEAGAKTATYTGRAFDLVLGSSAVALTIDGRQRTIPETTEIIRYSITKAGRRTLPPGHLPMCT
jgi:cytoskeleton protein RodZ